MLIKKPKLFRTQIRLSRIIVNSSFIETDIIKILSKIIVICAINFLSFVNIPLTRLKLKHRHKNWSNWPLHWNLINFWDCGWKETENKPHWGWFCTCNPLSEEPPSKETDPPFWSVRLVCVYTIYLNLWLDDVLHRFLELKILS